MRISLLGTAFESFSAYLRCPYSSLEHKEEYEKAKAAQERAIENSTFNFNKRRGINSELKQFREQKSEADKFEKLQRERVRGECES